MGSVATSLRLTGASFKLVFQSPAVLILPVFTLIWTALWVVGPISYFIWLAENHTQQFIDFWSWVYAPAVSAFKAGNYTQAVWWYTFETYAIWALFATIIFWGFLYFATVGMHVATTQIRNGKGDLSQAFGVANRNLGRLLLLALFNATVYFFIRRIVGTFFRAVLLPLPFVGRMIMRTVKLVLTAVSYLMLPIIVYERAGPFNAMSSAWNHVKKTWAGILVGTTFAYVAVFILTEVVIAALLQGALNLKPWTSLIAGLVIGGIIFSIASSVAAAHRAVLYWYATTGEVPAGFNRSDFPEIHHRGSITGAPIMVGVAVVPTAPAPTAYASQAPYPPPAYPQEPAYGGPAPYGSQAQYQPPVVTGTPMHSSRPARPKKQTTRLACPQCHTVIVVDFGQKPTCPTCGFGR